MHLGVFKMKQRGCLTYLFHRMLCIVQKRVQYMGNKFAPYFLHTNLKCQEIDIIEATLWFLGGERETHLYIYSACKSKRVIIKTFIFEAEIMDAVCVCVRG